MVDEYTTSCNKKREVPLEDDESATDAAAEILGAMINNSNNIELPSSETLPRDSANQASSSSSKRSRKEPTKQWMAYSGARHTRVGNDFQVALLPSPSPVAAAATNTPTTVSLAASPVHEASDVVDTTTATASLQQEEDEDEEETMDETDEGQSETP
jgi:hypothetical protein